MNVPATLQATIAARIDRLDPKAKRTLSAAAVVGSRFGLDLLKVLDFEPVVDELVGAELIDQVRFAREPEFVFHHPLIRAVAYEAQLKSDRAELHRSVAAAIEQREPDSVDENAALIATHMEAAGDLHSAYTWHMRAGAWSANRDVAAAQLSWERACQLADTMPGDEPGLLPLRIAPRTMLSASAWRTVHPNAARRFDELHSLCTACDDKASLRRRRDFARQRWPCGQHKIAVWRLAPTAAPRIPCVNLPMAAPFGLGSRRGICVYHRRCGTTSSARRERPLVHIRTRICAGDPVPLKPATLLPSSPTICRSGILKWLAIGMFGQAAQHMLYGRVREASRRVSECLTAVESIGDPTPGLLTWLSNWCAVVGGI